MRSYILAVAIAAATLTGCASDRDNRILTGAVVGGALGNVIGGGSTGATVGGAVLGGAIGAHTSDRRDDEYRRDTDYRYRYNNCLRYYSQRYCDRNIIR